MAKYTKYDDANEEITNIQNRADQDITVEEYDRWLCLVPNRDKTIKETFEQHVLGSKVENFLDDFNACYDSENMHWTLTQLQESVLVSSNAGDINLWQIVPDDCRDALHLVHMFRKFILYGLRPFVGDNENDGDDGNVLANEEENESNTILCSDICARCAKGGEFFRNKCPRCQETFYCSRQCQKKDWKSHKKVCCSTKKA
jgi:hypothetical protein